MKLPDRVTSTRLRCLQQDEVFYRAPAVLLDGFFKESDGLSELRVLQSVNAKVIEQMTTPQYGIVY